MSSIVLETNDESVDTSPLNIEDVSVKDLTDSVIMNKLFGSVKWFNSRSGYGFITVCGDNEYKGNDIFVHYTSINVSESQYKYLFQGEYVEFTLIKSTNSNHEFHAINITGICGGPIMCETRRSTVPEHNHTQTNNYSNNDRHEPRQHSKSQYSEGSNRNNNNNKYDNSNHQAHSNEENIDGFSKVYSKRSKRGV